MISSMISEETRFLAALLFLEIEKAFAGAWPSALFSEPRPSKNWPNCSTSLVEMRSLAPSFLSSRQELLNHCFLVHGAGGNVLIYRDLAKYLLADRPIYGLQSYGLDGSCDPLHTIEKMADAYIREIKKLQPSGLICSAVTGMGGTVALQMACRLIRNGDEVAFLGLLEHTTGPGCLIVQGLIRSGSSRKSLFPLDESAPSFRFRPNVFSYCRNSGS